MILRGESVVHAHYLLHDLCVVSRPNFITILHPPLLPNMCMMMSSQIHVFTTRAGGTATATWG